MRTDVKLVLVSGLLFLVALAAGCSTRPIADPVEGYLSRAGPTATIGEIDEAIWRAGRKAGWQVTTVEPGLLRGRFRFNQSVATVRIRHDRERFAIRYESSENMSRSDARIHRNYNTWVYRLARRIEQEEILPLSE